MMVIRTNGCKGIIKLGRDKSAAAIPSGQFPFQVWAVRRKLPPQLKGTGLAGSDPLPWCPQPLTAGPDRDLAHQPDRAVFLRS
jgi:hypothetical protein